MPHGILEFAQRMVGSALSLDIGSGRSVKLVGEGRLATDCQASDLQWSLDGTVLVAECQAQLRAWTLDGRELSRAPKKSPMSHGHLGVLAAPLRIVYFADSGQSQGRDPDLTIWDVLTGEISTLPVQLTSGDSFVVDQDRALIAIVHSIGPERDIKLRSLVGGAIISQFKNPSGAWSLRQPPGSQVLLLGGYDGVLRALDIKTGDLRELARPYTTTFPGGGGEDAAVDGLVPAPDGKSVALFKTSGAIRPSPGTNKIDMDAAKKWEEALGTTVEIRSTDDGRLLDRMPGQEMGVDEVAWDPRDRFIAVAGRDALFLWRRQGGAPAIRTYDESGRRSLAINGDGTRLALAAANGVRIFRIEEN